MGEEFQYRTFKYRLLPSKRQHKDLREILESQRDLYNGALESRISYYQKTGKSLSYFALCSELTKLRKDPDFARVPVPVQRSTLKRVSNAYNGFFTRVKAGKRAGLPRFKSRVSFSSFGFSEISGIRIKSRAISFKGLSGKLRMHMHRELPDSMKIVSCLFMRDAKGWSICLHIRIPCRMSPPTGKEVGLDFGISSLAVMSTGEAIENPQVLKRHARELRRLQRHVSRCRKGSNGRKKARKAVARLHLRSRNMRRTYLHQVSAKLVREYDVIAIEDLNVKGLARGILAKSVSDVAWATLREFISYKAEYAGRKIIAVNPHNTTQTCSGCGVIVPKTLGDRWHDCPECGLSLDRDHNAALFILARSGAMGSQDRVKWPISEPGNIGPIADTLSWNDGWNQAFRTTDDA